MKNLKLFLFVFVATLFVGFLNSCDSKSSNSNSNLKYCPGCHKNLPLSSFDNSSETFCWSCKTGARESIREQEKRNREKLTGSRYF